MSMEMNKALDLLREIRPSIPKEVLELWCKDRDAFLASHPAVEQAGGDERAVDGKPRATKCPDCGEGDLMPGDLCACGYETDPAAGYACSECDGSGDGYVGEVCRECDGSGWFVTPEQARAALAQPSPAQAEAEQPEVVAFRYRCTNAEGEPLPGWFYSDGAGTLGLREPLMAVSQHERIIGALRAVVTQLRQHKSDYMDAGQETYRALQNEIREREAEIARLDGLVSSRTVERDAAQAEVERLRQGMKGDYDIDAWLEWTKERDTALARVAALESKLAELEKQEPVATVARVPGEDWNGLHFYRDLQGIPSGTKLYTAPVAQAQHSVPEGFIGRLSEFLAQRGATGKALLRELRALCAAAPGKEVGHE